MLTKTYLQDRYCGRTSSGIPVANGHSSTKRMFQGVIRAFHLAFFERGLPERIALCFHSLEVAFRPFFEEVITSFWSFGYECALPDRFFSQTGKQLFVSFDDNYHSWFDAAPLLEKLGIRATFYVNTCVLRDRSHPGEISKYYDLVGHGGDRTPLSSCELVALASARHVIGSHTHTHRALTLLSPEQAKEDIRRGKMELEDLLGAPVDDFAYPFGMRRHFSEELRCYCRDIGFRTVANAIPGMQHCRQVATNLNRSPWQEDRPLSFNLRSVAVDGCLFANITGRSAVG